MGMLQNGLTYQDSHMASEEELMRTNLVPFEYKKPDAVSKGGPILMCNGEVVFTDASEAHSICIGDTGSGKTLKFIRPLLYSTCAAGESALVIDPKGDLYKKSSSMLRHYGYIPSAINLRRPSQSTCSWNPLWKAQENVDDLDKFIQALDDAFHSLFFSISAKDIDSYWGESAGMLATGICLLMRELREPITLGNMLKWRYQSIPNGHLDELFREMDKNTAMYQKLSVFFSLSADKTRSCILSTFDQMMRLFQTSPSLTELLSKSTFDMRDLATEKRIVFLIVPDEKTTYHFLASLFIQQSYQTLVDLTDDYDGKLPVRVNFVLEEFCNMPAIADIVPMLTAARSRNIRFHLVIQSYAQLCDKYNEDICKVVLDNCGNLIYLHTREMYFLSYISQLAGNNEFNHPLLSTTRLQHLNWNETLIFHDRCYPYLTNSIPLITDYPTYENED